MDVENKNRAIEWLEIILKKNNFNIVKYNFPNIKISGGYVSKMVNIKATVKKDGKTEILDLLVKSNQSKTEDIFVDAYLTEINIYSKIVPCFNEFAKGHKIEPIETIPLCYGVSTSDQNHVIVLENLKSKGFKVRDFAPLDIIHIKLLLKAFANWHAFSFALRDQKPEVFNKLEKPKLGLEAFPLLDSAVTSFEQQIDFAIGLCKKKSKPIALQKLKSLKKNIRVLFGKFLKNDCEEYVVITHADAWNNNFMFKYDEKSTPTEVRIIDWQTAILGSPLLDIAQIFFFCCFREELEHMDDLLELYYSTLSEKIRQLGSNPEKCFPWEACLSSFKRYAPLAIAAVPFIMRLHFSNQFMDVSNSAAEAPEDGDFCAIFGEEISDTEAYFERLNSILELCIERDLI